MGQPPFNLDRPQPTESYGVLPGEPPSRVWRPLVLGGVVGAVLLLIVAGVGLAKLGSEPEGAPGATTPRSQAPPARQALPSPSPPSAPAGRWMYIASRKTDPVPLSLDEVFTSKTINNEGRTYRMAARRLDTKCAAAVEGSKIRSQIARLGCSQVLRASFQSEKGNIIGTVGLVNLAESRQADRLSGTLGRSTHDFIKPLPGSGRTRYLGRGAALGGPWVRGHYVIVFWFQFTDGHRPSDAEKKKLSQAVNDIVRHTVAHSIGARMFTGKPPTR